MPAHVFNGVAWKASDNAYVFNNGAWRKVYQIYVHNSGAWKKLWTYAWQYGNWGGCSASCGGGTQTRTVTCKNNRGATVEDWKCQSYAGAAAAASQACNTQTCVTYECLPLVVGGGSNSTVDSTGLYYWAGTKIGRVSGGVTTPPQPITANGCKYYPGTAIQDYGDYRYYQICRCCPNC